MKRRRFFLEWPNLILLSVIHEGIVERVILFWVFLNGTLFRYLMTILHGLNYEKIQVIFRIYNISRIIGLCMVRLLLLWMRRFLVIMNITQWCKSSEWALHSNSDWRQYMNILSDELLLCDLVIRQSIDITQKYLVNM